MLMVPAETTENSLEVMVLLPLKLARGFAETSLNNLR